ncbi:MAG: DNA repair exonuclease [Candidatus Aenigmatarchaeota archaeon]
MRFAHLSDCHLGAWSSHPDLKELPAQAFEKAIDRCIAERVDFILISGDLFDNALPGIDVLRRAVIKLKQCKDNGIAIYTVAGSHDFSPTGKTFLSVLEDAGLIENVKFEENGKVKLNFIKDATGAKIAGIVGRKGALEKDYFENLEESSEDGFKIFMFHSAVKEFRGFEDTTALPLTLLPKGFDYYASGHVHDYSVNDFNGKKVVFPGVLFPTNFQELEKYDSGFYIVEVNDSIEIKRVEIRLNDVVLVKVNANGKSPMQVENEIVEKTEKEDIKNAILLLKVEGCLENGKPSDIDFKNITSLAADALTVKKNTSKLTSKEFEEVAVKSVAIEEIEKEIIKNHGKPYGEDFIFALMNVLQEEKLEDETSHTYDDRIKSNVKKVLGI